jgi:rubrerythrin
LNNSVIKNPEEAVMAEKKAVAKGKTAVKKTSTKSTPTRKTAAKKMAKGQSYACDVCGLVVTVDEVCGCVGVCDIVCCGEPMQAA